MENPLVVFWHWTVHDPVAFYTSILAVSTIGLWIITWRGIRSQSIDTRILQRAYLSVEPAGLNPYLGHEGEGRAVAGHVRFRNLGHLPARNVSWSIYIKFSPTDELNDFPIAEHEFGG